MQKKRIFIFPGSFDPLTSGHLDIIERAAKLCDELVVAVLENQAKKPTFSLDERIAMTLRATSHCDNIRVIGYQGLIADFYTICEAAAVVRGVRNEFDFNYEQSMAAVNRQLNPNFETIFLACRQDMSHISSSTVRELGYWGADLSGMIPACNLEQIQERLRTDRTRRNGGE